MRSRVNETWEFWDGFGNTTPQQIIIIETKCVSFLERHHLGINLNTGDVSYMKEILSAIWEDTPVERVVSKNPFHFDELLHRRRVM